MASESAIIPIEPGCQGKAHILETQLFNVIWAEEFGDMTIAEMLGVLDLVKLELALKNKNRV
jgi:hypothetical protein